jgi:hypothetical protein
MARRGLAHISGPGSSNAAAGTIGNVPQALAAPSIQPPPNSGSQDERTADCSSGLYVYPVWLRPGDSSAPTTR